MDKAEKEEGDIWKISLSLSSTISLFLNFWDRFD